MSVREKDNPALYTRIQEQNLLRQYDLLSNCIEIGLEKGIEAFDKYTLWALNYAAVANIAQFGIMGTWHRISAKHLAAYLEEMSFRFNRRKHSDLFIDTLRHMVTAPILTFEKLTADKFQASNF
jgi:hypothetical protein